MDEPSEINNYLLDDEVIKWFNLNNGIIALTNTGIARYGANNTTDSDQKKYHSSYNFDTYSTIKGYSISETSSNELPSYVHEIIGAFIALILSISGVIVLSAAGYSPTSNGVLLIIAAILTLISVLYSVKNKESTINNKTTFTIRFTDESDWEFQLDEVDNETVQNLSQHLSKQIN